MRKISLGSMHDLSDQIRKVEIWTRDEFVRKESFRDICTRIESIVAEQGRTLNSAVQGLQNPLSGLLPAMTRSIIAITGMTARIAVLVAVVAAVVLFGVYVSGYGDCCLIHLE